MPSKEKVVRNILWSGTKTSSLDYCCVKRETEGWHFSGMIVAKFQTHPFGAHYEILVDKTFKTRRLAIEKIDAGKATHMEIEFRDGIWTVDDKKRTDLRECTDVDIEASPITNTIPIRRA